MVLVAPIPCAKCLIIKMRRKSVACKIPEMNVFCKADESCCAPTYENKSQQMRGNKVKKPRRARSREEIEAAF